MRQLSRLLTLLLLFIHLSSKSQTDVQRDKRIDLVLKQVDAKLPGLKMFGRKEGGYVNMAVLQESTSQLKWFTCHGIVFDSAQLQDDEYRQIFAGSLDPFIFYRNYCYEKLFYIEHAQIQYRLRGKEALQDTSHNSSVVFNAAPVKSAQSTMQKMIAMEMLMKRIALQLRLFDCITPRQLATSRSDSSHVSQELAGVMIRKVDSTEYFNTDFLVSVAKIVLRRRSPDRLFVYNREGRLMDSVPLKPDKYASLLKDKEDVFLLYRGWLELQWQQITEGKRHFGEWLHKKDSNLYSPASWAANKSQVYHELVDLQEQQNIIGDKISNLIIPEEKYVEQLMASIYNNNITEISYLPGLGFAYTISYTRGQKMYELTDHRDNVVAVISDKKKGKDENGDNVVEYYNSDVVNTGDYAPFGMLLPGRGFNAENKYRYGFNGKENDSEVKGEGNQYDYGFRIYDSRIGRFLSTDPLFRSYPWYTPYQFAGNKPIVAVDLDGMEEFVKTSWHNVTGKIYRTALTYDETAQPLPGNVIHHIHNYVDKDGKGSSIDVPEGLGAIDFVNSTVGYNNERGNPDFSVKRTDNAFVDSKGNSLFWEFYNGTGSENTVINGGKVIEDIKNMDSFKELKIEAFKKWNADDKVEPGESFKGYHRMSYAEGITEIWIPGLFKDKGDPSGPFGSTQHFLGSYSLEMKILDDGQTVLFTIGDSKSLESFTDHQSKGNSVDRTGNTPLGTTYQRYMWTEKIDTKEVEKATHCTVCGKKLK